MSLTLWNPSPVPVFLASGQFASGAQAYFYTAGSGGSAPIAVFQDGGGSIQHTIPVIADQIGVFAPVYLPFGDYRVRVLDQNGALLYDADNIANAAPPSAGGGIAVSSDMVFQTGDPFWRLRSGVMLGFVRMNARTIGSPTSGASEYANDTARDLFLFLWGQYPDAIAPVIGGRGASADADWNANKQITIPEMRGLLPGAVDDMGGTAANKIQVSTTCTTNGTTAIVTVVSAAGLAVGMFARVNNVAAGTITLINGLLVTLSVIPAGPQAGVSFRASPFSDAQAVATVNGAISFVQKLAQIAPHGHGVTDPNHVHTASTPNGFVNVTGGPGFNVALNQFGNTNSASTGISIQTSGSGQPIMVYPPTRLGTWYMKL